MGQFCCAPSCRATCTHDLFLHEQHGLAPPLSPACSAHAMLGSGRRCASPGDVGCLVPGANEAMAHYCFWLHHGGHLECTRPTAACIERALEDKAARRNVTAALLKAHVLQHCLPHPPHVDSHNLSKAVTRGSCTARVDAGGERLPAVWVSLVVKDQTALLTEWLLWHLLIGATHALVYDNDSQDPAALAAVMRPFEQSGTATRVHWPGHATQTTAYENAIRRAKNAGVPFVGFVDADERFVPYGFGEHGCLQEMMSLCTTNASCAGMRLSTRVTLAPEEHRRPVSVTKLPQPSSPKPQTALQATRFDVGRWDGAACCTVKTIVRVTTHRSWKTPHSTFVRQGWCHLDEELKCPRAAGMPFHRVPMTGARGFVLHQKCRTLFEWVMRQSMTGRIDLHPGNKCDACFGDLEDIIANFQKSCGLPARDEPPLKPAQFTAIPAAGEESARAFLKRVDAQVGELMFG